MTREEFLADINDWDELISFCYENELEATNDIVDTYRIDELLALEAEQSWVRAAMFISGVINNLDDDYYKIDGYGNLDVLDASDFETYKDDALYEAENKGVWD